MKNSIPENLIILHSGEEELRAKAIEFVGIDPDLHVHLDIVERAMDLLDVYRQQPELTDDGRALQHLAIRVFNAFATSWKLMSAGYHQVAALILRDVIETVYLVDHFRNHPDQVTVWRCADKKTLLREFSPSVIRKALDDFQGWGKSRRHEIYERFCSLAAHPSVAGFAMLRPLGMDAHMGPFMDVTVLRALLEEQGQLAIQAGFCFLSLIDKTSPPASGVVHRFIMGSMDYSNKYFDKKYSEADIREVNELFFPKNYL